MSLFDVALEYASHRSLSWGRMLIVARTDAGFSYRIVASKGKGEAVPVVSVPCLPVDGAGLSLLAWLFGRHATYMDAGVSHSPSTAMNAWRDAEEIYTDLCLLVDLPRDPDAFSRQRQAMSLAS